MKLYTRKALSHLSDKLAAISGIAAMVAEKEKACYRFGIFEQDIAGLTWTIGAKETRALEQYPSWSWLSWNGPINYRIYTEPRLDSKNGATIIGKDIDLDAKAKDGNLMLCGLTKPVRCLTWEQRQRLNRETKNKKWVSPDKTGPDQWLRLCDDDFWIDVYDDQRSIQGVASMDQYLDRYAHNCLGPEADTCIALCICERLRHSGTGAPTVRETVDVSTYFLLIHPEDEPHDRWKRLGLGVTREIRDVSLKEDSKMSSGSPRRRICLI